MPKNTETTNETNEQDATSMLVGYVRRSGAGGALKVSIDTEAIQACSTYTTSDGKGLRAPRHLAACPAARARR